ncbi:MAG: TRAP transporter substrate-binding protein DctP [Deltaproteobacteria bacterium]|nr:TRAP transporter substrate-binding protein DctP [Deltaproteobacteria bacterium]
MKKLVWVFIMVMSLVFCMNANVIAAEKVWKLKGTTFIPPSGARWDNVLDFVAKLKERTNGRVILEVAPSGGLCSSWEEYDYLSQGYIDFAQLIDAWALTHHNEFGLLGMALIKSNEVPDLMKAGVMDIWAEITAKNNIKLLAVWSATGYNCHAIKHRFINGPADFDNIPFFATGAIFNKIHEILGAKPTPVPNAEAFSAYTTGVLKGSTSSLSTMYSYKNYEPLPYLSYYPSGKNLGLYAFMPAFNMKVWNSFPADIQETIQKTADEIMEVSVSRWKKADEKALEFFKTIPDKVFLNAITDAEADTIIKKVRKPIQAFFVEQGKGKGREKELMDILNKFTGE